MDAETIKLLLLVFGRSLGNVLIERGKLDEASLIGDALAAVRAGRNINAALSVLAAQWAEFGEPKLAEITAARLAIQAQMV